LARIDFEDIQRLLTSPPEVPLCLLPFKRLAPQN
jgi:hypothetical protein